MEEKISVIMSVYNESIEELGKAIHSILNQTYSNFEFIIVNDNPERNDLNTFLKNISTVDKRIITIVNDYNIGLAMSLNKAIEKATNEIIVRMDADDISEIDRFEKEVKVLKSENADLVFTNYLLIDEADNVIGEKKDHYTCIRRDLILSNIIHHPTVIYKKHCLEEIGCYRDFPCSQDYDLWLRFMDSGYNIVQLDECLLRYRIRPNSISNKRALMQIVTLVYIKRLFFQRYANGRDYYSKDNYNDFLLKFKNEIDNSEKTLKIRNMLESTITNPMIWNKLYKKLYILIISKCFREYAISKIQSKIFTLFNQDKTK